MEINCNKCQNLLNKVDGCKLYGSDPAIATLACTADRFKNYSPKKEPRPAFTPGERVYVVVRDEDGNAFDVTGFIYLAEVAGTIIATPKVYGCDTLEEIMKYHSGETAKDYDLSLGVYPAEDCYVYRCEAEEVLTDEMEDDDE